jgi:hypothetical protein
MAYPDPRNSRAIREVAFKGGRARKRPLIRGIWTICPPLYIPIRNIRRSFIIRFFYKGKNAKNQKTRVFQAFKKESFGLDLHLKNFLRLLQKGKKWKRHKKEERENKEEHQGPARPENITFSMDRSSIQHIISAEQFKAAAKTLREAEEIITFVDSQGRPWKNMYADSIIKAARLALAQKSLEELELISTKPTLPKLGNLAKLVLYSKLQSASPSQAEALPKVMGFSMADLAKHSAAPEVEMGERVRYESPKYAPAKKKAPTAKFQEIEVKGQEISRKGSFGTLLPVPKSHEEKNLALFKVYYGYERIPGAFDPKTGEVYDRNFECYLYSRDYEEEHRDLADETRLRALRIMLENGTPPTVAFGFGGVRGQGFNGWRKNLELIIEQSTKGHARNGRLVKAIIYFQRLRQQVAGQSMALEVYRYEA